MNKAPISRIDNAYTRAQDQAQQSGQKTVHAQNHRRNVHKRRLLFLLALFVIIFAVGGVRLYNIAQQQRVATANLTAAKKQLKKVNTKKEALKIQVDQLNNESYLAKLVRAKFYVSKSGEIIFNVPAKADQIPGADSGK